MKAKNKILSFLLAVIMILSVVPALTVSAAEPIDLIHASGTTFREGVFYTYAGGVYGSFTPEKAVNNNMDHGWYSAFSPKVTPWYQINFPLASQWTKIDLKMGGGDFKCAIKVLASNDPSFETYDVIEETDTFSTYITIDDASKFTKAYRYFRIVSKGARMAVMEIDIKGYAPTAPSTDGLVDLAQKPDVYAKAQTADVNTYKAQQVLDGDAQTAYTATGTTPELMLDLRYEADIKAIEFTPASGNEAYRKNYEIHTSNDATFASYDIIYKTTTASAEGAAVTAYMPEGKTARYVRIKSDGTDLGVAELKALGTDCAHTLKNLVNPASVTATTGANPEYTADGDAESVWSSEEEATKASITYNLAGTDAVTSIMLLPDNSEESRKNFNIYGSVSGDFTDAEQIAAVAETPLAIGQYEIVALDEPKAYKAIKIEKAQEPSLAGDLAFREVKIIHNSQETVVKLDSTVPADGATGITNFSDNAASLTNLIEVTLNRTIVASSINPTNVVIKDITDGEENTLTNWTPYEVSGKKFSIDVASLSSNKTYEVTLTTGVLTTVGNLPEEQKFTFTTGNVISVPYDPDKVLLNIVTDKRITGNRHTSFGPLTNVIDGNTGTYALTSGAPALQIDLGNTYEVVAFELTPHSGVDNKHLLQNLRVLGSDKSIDFSASDLSPIALATYPADSTKTEVLVLDNPENVRYLGLYRASLYAVISEFKAYAYVDKDSIDLGAWKVNSSSDTSEFAQAGTYTFSIPVNNLGEEESYYMTVFAYDNNGSLVQKANTVKTAASGKSTLSAEVTLSAEDFAKATQITAVLYKSQNNAKMVVDAKTITKTGADLTPPATVSARDAVKLEYTATTDGERVAVQVLGPDGTGLGYDFDEVGEVAFNTELCYSVGTKALAKGEKETFYFKVANAEDFGEYSIRMTVTKANGTTTKYDSYLLYLSDANINECLEEFKAFPSALTMRQLIDKWSDNLATGRKYFKMSEIPASLSTSIPAGFDEMFEYLCDLYVADGNMTQMSDVLDCLNASYVMAMYEAGDAAQVKTALTKYAGDINGLYARKDAEGKETINVDKYSQIFTNLKGNITDAATLKNVMQWTVPLSLIQGGTRKDVENAMNDYAGILAYDATYASDNGVTLDMVAMKISTSDASSYYNAFDAAFVAAVDAVLADPELTPSVDTEITPEVSPGVGSHGTRPATTPSKQEDESTTPITPVEPVEPETEKAVFNDIDGIDWAKDYINTLYKEGIISGDGDGNFHPDRHVTREEFLKMLIEALKIDIASKEATEFEDCDPGAWYYPYVQIASSNKITKGIDRKNFGIGQSITRQDMAVLLSKALAIKNITATASDYVFDDDINISEYAKSDVSKMYSIGMISGMGNGTFAPQDYTTRAQAAVIIGRALEVLGGASK